MRILDAILDVLNNQLEPIFSDCTGCVATFSYYDRVSLSEYLQSSVGRQLQEGSASKIIPLVQCWTSEWSPTDRK